MRYFSIFLLLSGSFFIFSCKNDSKSASNSLGYGEFSANPNNLAGNWINLDFINRTNTEASVIKAQNKFHLPYALGISFLSQYPDSVVIFKGDTAFVRPLKYNVDTLEIVNALPNGDSQFLIYASESDKNITFFDRSGGRTVMDKFTKTENKEQLPVNAFHAALNHNLLQGQFFLTENGKRQQVLFLPDGRVGGLGEYMSYIVCVRGNCFKLGAEMDVISFFKKDGQIDEFGFVLSPDKAKLELYSLKNTDVDGNTVIRPDKVRYVLTR